MCVFAKSNYAVDGKGESISPAPYVILSSFLIGANAGINVANTFHIIKGTNKKGIPITGLFSGASQIALGMGNYSAYKKELREFSILNIGLGTATMILSAWNLIDNKSHQEKKTSFNFYSFPTTNGNIGFALTIARNF